MNNKKIDLLIIRAACKKALCTKNKNVCELTLYSAEVEFLINTLTELIEKEN